MRQFCKIIAAVPLLGIPALCIASEDVVVSMPAGMKDLEGLKFEEFRKRDFGMTFIFSQDDERWRLVVILLDGDTPPDKRPTVADVHRQLSSKPESFRPMKRVSELGSMMGTDGETWHYFTAVSPGEPPAKDEEWVPDPTPVMWAEGRRAGYRVQLYVADKDENASTEKLGKIAENLINAMIRSLAPPNSSKPVEASQDR